MESHKLELENLSILNHLDHPNILELLASYTYDEKHNLIFPLAEEGTLDKLFESEPESSPFRSDEAFYIALAGLSSGIEHVHNFIEKRINLSLIGCHHDLRPKNILVSRNTFILADFGLSRFKDSSESSKTSFKKGKDDYLAPECGNPLENFERQDIRRSSDIWSFGCILSEVATYMSRGPSAIQAFREKRKLRIYNFTIAYFHCGPNQRNRSVDDWLVQLEGTASKSFKMLLVLIRHMLHLNQAERPKADVVTARLQFIAIYEVVESVDRLFAEILSRNKSFDALLEKERFAGWKYALGLLDPDDSLASLNFFDKDLSSGFNSILENLSRIKNYLNSILGQNPYAQHLSFLPLCHLNDQLSNIFNLERRERARSYFKATMVESENANFLNTFKESSNIPLDREIRMRATLTQMTRLVVDYSQMHGSLRLLNTAAIKIGKSFGDHYIGSFSDNGVVRQILVEWRYYTKELPVETANQELFVRVDAIADLLSQEKPDEFRALHCRGFFHDESRCAFGVVFDFPLSTAGVEPITLHEFITKNQRMANQPLLEDRFMFAYTLAKSVLEFHMVGWLHKCLTASNVAFFLPKRSSFSKQDMQPYVTGFNHSRPDEPFAFSSKFKADKYRHPSYAEDELRRYCPEFDYYSLGIILLEIGLWNALECIIPKIDTYPNSKVQEKLIESRVSLLGQSMGVAYRDAVRTCLEGNFAKNVPEDERQHDSKSVHLDFERLVVSPLKRCWTQLEDCITSSAMR